MSWVEFAQLKRTVSLERVLDAYGVKLAKSGESLRGACPLCGSKAKRAFVATPSENLWHCFQCNKGGDIIAFVAELKGLRPKEAGLDIQERCCGVNHEPRQQLEPLDYLLSEHEAVQALGIPVAVAETMGCGYAKKGIMRGRIAFPLRTEDGTLIAYCGFNPNDGTLKLPKMEDA